jgi:hypothetical protein
MTDYITHYFGPLMHINLVPFALAIQDKNIPQIEDEYKKLVLDIRTNHKHHLEEINRNFNRLRSHVAYMFAGQESRPPTLDYVFFEDGLVSCDVSNVE